MYLYSDSSGLNKLIIIILANEDEDTQKENNKILFLKLTLNINNNPVIKNNNIDIITNIDIFISGK